MPPAFHVDLVVPRAWDHGVRFLTGLGLWAGLFWLGALAQAWPPALVPGLLCAFIAVAMAALLPVRWLPGDEGRLAWDGQRWTFAGPEVLHKTEPGRLLLCLDLGFGLLLRWQGEGPGHRVRWWPVAATGVPAQALHALRIAVYCRRSEDDLTSHRDARTDE